MGNFKQHVTCSTMTGIVIGGAAYHFGFSMPTCLLSAGLCGMAGMLPDIDSDSSRSFQECIYFAAGLSSVLLVDRLRQFGLDRDIIMLSGAIMFLFVRFGIGELIKKITSHRGMFHSIPAAILAGEIVFFLTVGEVVDRAFKSFALSAGYFSHLILDEICSIDSTGKTIRLKKSFGTALKLFDSKRMPATIGLYFVVVFLGVTAVKSPDLMKELESSEQQIASGERASPLLNPLENFFNVLANLESEAVSQWGNASRSAGAQESRKIASSLPARTEPAHFENVSSIGIPKESAPPAGVPGSLVSNDPGYSDHRLFSRIRNEQDNEQSSGVPATSATSAMPTRNTGLSSSTIPTIPATQAMPSYMPPTVAHAGSAPAPAAEHSIGIPRSVTPTPLSLPSNPSNGMGTPAPMQQAQPTANYGATPGPFRLSGNDFAPRGLQHLKGISPGAPAPLQFP